MTKRPENRLSGLKANLAASPGPVATAIRTAPSSEGIPMAAKVKKIPFADKKARAGKRAIVGYFSQELAKTLRHIAVDENTTIQAIVGEGLDLFLEKRGRHPFGERGNGSDDE